MKDHYYMHFKKRFPFYRSRNSNTNIAYYNPNHGGVNTNNQYCSETFTSRRNRRWHGSRITKPFRKNQCLQNNQKLNQFGKIWNAAKEIPGYLATLQHYYKDFRNAESRSTISRRGSRPTKMQGMLLMSTSKALYEKIFMRAMYWGNLLTMLKSLM